jgi:hypothetical protein
LADIETIKVSMNAHDSGGGDIVLPAGNRNFFSRSGSYVHVDKEC